MLLWRYFVSAPAPPRHQHGAALQVLRATMLARRSVLVLALILAVATCLRSPAHGRAAPRIHRSRPSRPGRLPPPRAELNVFDEINEEARGSWLSRFLPGGERSEQREMISEQPVLFTKMDAIGEPVFDYDRWAVHRSADRYNPNPSPSPSPNPNPNPSPNLEGDDGARAIHGVTLHLIRVKDRVRARVRDGATEWAASTWSGLGTGLGIGLGTGFGLGLQGALPRASYG